VKELKRVVLHQLLFFHYSVSLFLSIPTAVDPSLGPLEMLKTKEFYMLWFTFFFNQQAIGWGTVMYKPFGQAFIHDDRFLALLGSVASVFNLLGRIFWGALADRTSYRVLVSNLI
jgi:MFS family permease